MPYKWYRLTVTHACGHTKTYRFRNDRELGTAHEQAADAALDECEDCQDEWMRDTGGEGSWDGAYFTDGAGEEHHVANMDPGSSDY